MKVQLHHPMPPPPPPPEVIVMMPLGQARNIIIETTHASGTLWQLHLELKAATEGMHIPSGKIGE